MSTLTYNPESAPILEFRRYGRDITYLCQNDSSRPRYLEIVNRDFPLTDSMVSRLRRITKIQHGITYVCRHDVTCFLKRLRKRLNKFFPNEKISYYLVSEYGPATFRAHYHLVFLTDSPSLAKILSDSVNSCWQLGFTNTTLLASKSKAASYVASYVASSTSMPKLYQSCNFLKVFSSHSCRQTIGCFDSSISEIYENPVDNFMSTQFYSNGKLLEARPSRSDKNYFFPKIYRFSDLSVDDVAKAYKSFQVVARVFQSENIKYLSNRLYDFMFSLGSYGTAHTLDDYNLRYLSQFFYYYINFSYVTDRETLVSRISSVLSCSRTFYNRICNNNPNTFYLRIRQLYNFYNYIIPIDIINRFYQQQVDFFDSRPLPSYDSFDYYNLMLAYQQFYDNPESLEYYIKPLGKPNLRTPYLTFGMFDIGLVHSFISSQITFSERSKIKYQNSLLLNL